MPALPALTWGVPFVLRVRSRGRSVDVQLALLPRLKRPDAAKLAGAGDLGSTCRRDRPPLDVLGDQTYESLARRGERMTTAAMATYA